MKLWLCADTDGAQWLISSLFSPVYNKEEDNWECDRRTFNNKCFIGYNRVPSVTFENSPQQVEISLIKDKESSDEQ